MKGGEQSASLLDFVNLAALSGKSRALRQFSPLVSGEEAGLVVARMISKTSSSLAGRIGSTELRSCLRMAMQNAPVEKKLEFFVNGYGSPLRKKSLAVRLKNKSGVFPASIDTLARFSSTYLNAISDLDFLASWVPGENLLSQLSPRYGVTSLGNLEPFRNKTQWTSALEGKRLLVVHPFTDTITAQFDRRADLRFRNKLLLPELELICVKAVQSLAGQESEHPTWFDALDAMKADISEKSFDVAVIGAGAYGLPLGQHVKAMGKPAVVLGGATQLLFGIRGRRWDRHPDFQGAFQGPWVYPSPQETPGITRFADSGAYWR